MAIAFVNRAFGSNDASGGSIASAGANHTAGNTLVVCVAFGTNAVTISSITDTAGNTYTQATGAFKAVSGFGNTDIWYCTNILGNATNIVTVNFSSASTFRRIFVCQYSGLATSGVFDTANNGTGTGTAMVCTGYTTASASEVDVAFYSTAGSTTFTAGTSYTLRGASGEPNLDSHTEDFIMASAQSVTGPMTQGAAVQWVGSHAAFREVAAGFIAEDDSFKIPVGSPIDLIVSVWG